MTRADWCLFVTFVITVTFVAVWVFVGLTDV